MNEIRQLFINISTHEEKFKQMKAKQVKQLTSKIPTELPTALTSLLKTQQVLSFSNTTLGECKQGHNNSKVLALRIMALVTTKTAAPL
jgi:hypothetical protein